MLLLQVLADEPPESSGLGWVANCSARALGQRGWTVDRITAGDVLPRLRGRTYGAVPAALAWRVVQRVARETGPVVVEGHGFHVGLVSAALRALNKPNVSMVVRCHGWWRAAVAVAAADEANRAPNLWTTSKSALTYGTLESLAARNAQGIVVQCSKDREFTLLVDGMDAQRVATIPTPVELPAQARVVVPDGPITLLWVGRRSLVKGTDILWRVVERLEREEPRVRVVLVGITPQEAPRTGNVTVVPPVERAQLAAYYGAAHGFLWPSRYEGFGLAPLEAMAHGVPVISTPVGGMRDLLRDGTNGILAQDTSEEAQWDALRRFLAIPDTRLRTMRAAARATAEGLTQAAHGDALHTFYAGLPRG